MGSVNKLPRPDKQDLLLSTPSLPIMGRKHRCSRNSHLRLVHKIFKVFLFCSIRRVWQGKARQGKAHSTDHGRWHPRPIAY